MKRRGVDENKRKQQSDRHLSEFMISFCVEFADGLHVETPPLYLSSTSLSFIGADDEKTNKGEHHGQCFAFP